MWWLSSVQPGRARCFQRGKREFHSEFAHLVPARTAKKTKQSSTKCTELLKCGEVVWFKSAEVMRQGETNMCALARRDALFFTGDITNVQRSRLGHKCASRCMICFTALVEISEQIWRGFKSHAKGWGIYWGPASSPTTTSAGNAFGTAKMSVSRWLQTPEPSWFT